MSEFTEQSGIVIRDDLSVLVWSGSTRIEVNLLPAQARQLAEGLLVKSQRQQTRYQYLIDRVEAGSLCQP